MSISDAGRVNFMKKLNYTPVCFHAFALEWYRDLNARLIYAVISHDSRLFIYDESTVIWVVQLESAPKAVSMSSICNLHGALVMLDAKGLIEVFFLGSEPYIFKVHSINSTALSYEKISKELFVLERQIRKSIISIDRQAIKSVAEKYIDMKIQTSNELRKCSQDTSRETNLTCLLMLSIKVNTKIDELQIIFNSSEGIFCSQKVIMYTDLSEKTTFQTKVTIYKLKVQVLSTKLEILISFVRGQSAPRVIKRTRFLPYHLFYEALVQEDSSANEMNVSLCFLKKVQLQEFVHIVREKENIFKSDRHYFVLRDVYNQKLLSILTATGGLCSKVQANSLEDLVPVLARLIAHGKSSKCLSKTNLNKNYNNRLDDVIICSPDISMEDTIKRIFFHYEIQQQVKQKTVIT